MLKALNQSHTNRVKEWTGIDNFIAREEIFSVSYDECASQRLRALEESISHHYENNQGYRKFCSVRNFSPIDFCKLDDCPIVPLIPSSLFKLRGLISPTIVGSDSSILETTSSGTKGAISIVPRDDDTLMRFFATVTSGVREVLEISNYSMPVFNLGPSVEEANHLWISYVMAGASVIFHSRNYVSNENLNIDLLMADLEQQSGRIVLIGPPALIAQLATVWRSPLPRGSKILTIGGWKKSETTKIRPQEFREMCDRTFQVRQADVRDVFNMVELNSSIFECEHHVKHIPPWLEVMALHPKTMSPISDGGRGILAYLDPTTSSYPGFIFSDDIGSVTKRFSCDCGRVSDTLEILRRVNTIETRGCAMKMNYPSQEARN